MIFLIVDLSVAAFLSALSLRVTDGLLPRLGQDFSSSLTATSHVVTVFAVTYGLSQAAFGPLGDKYGKLRIIGLACLGSAFASLLCALAPDLQWLIYGRALAGFCTAAIIPLAMAWIGDKIAYEKRQPILARFLLGQILGMSMGIWLGGLAADYLSWRTPFYAIAAGFFAVGMILLRENARNVLEKVSGKSPLFRGARDILAHPWARIVLATAYLEGTLLFGILAFISTYLHQRHPVSLATASSMVMLFGFGGMVYALNSHRFLSFLGEIRLIRWGGCLMGLSLAAVALATKWQWGVPAFLLCGIGFYMMHNTLQTRATQMAPAHRGVAVSLYASCFFLGQASGAALFGYLLARVNGTATIVAGALGLWLLSLFFARACGAQRRERVDDGLAPRQ